MRGDAGARIRGRCASFDVFLRQAEARNAANAAASAAASALATSVASSRTPPLPQAPATPASAFGTTAAVCRFPEKRGVATTEGADRRGEPPESLGWPHASWGRGRKGRRTRAGDEVDAAADLTRDTRAAPRAAGA
jgi:hypothetical protein